MVKRILVPYDGSEPASRALDQAVNITKSHASKTEVILLHVIAEFPNYHFIDRPVMSKKTGGKTTLSQYLIEVYELMEKNASDAVAKKKEEIKKSSDYDITTKVLSGHISETIIDFAKKEKADLIIIGNVGRSGISRIRTLGSVLRSVSERGPCPVMIVH